MIIKRLLVMVMIRQLEGISYLNKLDYNKYRAKDKLY